MPSLDDFANEKLAELEQAHLRRSLAETERTDGVRVVRNGRPMLSFSCNDYLGLTHHPVLKAAAIAAIERHGVGAGASRLVTGNHPLYLELETRLARLKGTESACVFGSGYLVNAGVTPALARHEDLVLIDELAHSSLWTGARLSRATVHAFKHNDLSHAEALMKQHRAAHRRVLIVTEGVFSMDGDCAPLAELTALAERWDAWLLADDAHDLDFAVAACANVPLRVGTLSKALGGYGGYVAASKSVIELIRNRARPLIYTTGLPPATLASAIAALDLIEQEPALLAQPLAKAQAFTRAANQALAQSAIVPIVIGKAQDALDASRLLEDEGFLVVAIRPPTVPENTARLRLTFSAMHSGDDISRLAAVFRERILPGR
jgi:8-amino-7-oxononanoate synthase